MTRGIFDPTGGETERSGSTHLGPEASNASHLPPDIVDGREESHDAPDAPAVDADEAAQRLRKMGDDPGA